MPACARRPGATFVLLNSDTLVAPGWLEELRAVAYGAPDIGTVTPLSNDATILSYPDPAGGNDLPDLGRDGARRRAGATGERRHARSTSRSASDSACTSGAPAWTPSACCAPTCSPRATARRTTSACARAILGWRHVAAPGVFVAHVGGHSFGTAARHLRARNAALLERLHPGYAALIEAHVRADPLAAARRRLDLARWRAARRRGSQAVILITHAAGGGVERQIAASVERHRDGGLRAIVLRPSRAP